eukprot:CAMPEP_0184689156 /NCGR_PEP_ID=MMETSP0312-20130426/30500_1 /TAXON_ID=31354 /ORGANISM="Compsopogon coeruleus, Strain SAG 36.94" /LENGTH=962 /DNA_ID=CAMNT_0027146473 /DNA_START=91 /DNA_END=2979 /DNA_ORIENTATION=-
MRETLPPPRTNPVVASILATVFAGLVAVFSVWVERYRESAITDMVDSSMDWILDENGVGGVVTVTVKGQARFQFFAARMVRMEYAPSQSAFEDRPTLVFAERDLYGAKEEGQALKPEVTVRADEGGRVVMTVDHGLTVEYSLEAGGTQRGAFRAKPFRADNLVVRFDLGSWRPGDTPSGNLKGTTRTLDRADGEVPLELGLLSRDGWSLIDDSRGPILQSLNDVRPDHVPWVEKRKPPKGYTDWTLLAYGHDYRTALKEFTILAGSIPIPPKFAFGVWWSRWWIYTDDQLKQLVGDFRKHRVPLDILVIDMDWHLTAYEMMNAGYVDLARQPLGWTGYTWNKSLFPDPAKFLTWCHEQDLRVTLNLHPASGVQPFEEKFVPMALAMGIDPHSKPYKHVPFDIADERYARNWFDIILRDLEKQGIDFWWLDWQQKNRTSLGPELNPTIWLNHVFFHDMERRRGADHRGFIFHRWGGLGNHRYQIGFSGDTWITWESLKFQVYFTATAANVGFAFWSHDIGGFMSKDKTEAELFLRWIQWGALSPIFRTHAWRVKWIERRIWMYGDMYLKLMREAINLRYSLLPFLYSEARKTHETSVAALHPLYYEYPEMEESYSYPTQFMLGLSMMVSPIVAPAERPTYTSTKESWVPPGTWIEWHSLRQIVGPKKHSDAYSLDEIPIFVKAGTVIPMAIPGINTSPMEREVLVISVFPGPQGVGGEYFLYEDDGISKAYKQSGFGTTRLQSERYSDTSMKFVAGPRSRNLPGLSETRSYSLRFVGVPPPQRVTVGGEELSGKIRDVLVAAQSYRWSSSPEMNDEVWGSYETGSSPGPIVSGWVYEPERLTLTVNVEEKPCIMEVSVLLEFSESFAADLEAIHSGIIRLNRKASRIQTRLSAGRPVKADEALMTRLTGMIDELSSLPDRIVQNKESLTELLNSSMRVVADLELVLREADIPEPFEDLKSPLL